MFDVDRSKKISRKNFCSVICCRYFADENETAEEREKRVENAVNDVFKKYDEDNDGFLNWNEFYAWAQNAKEMELILELFSEIEQQLISSDSGQ